MPIVTSGFVQEVPIVGILAFLTISPAAIESELPQLPIIAVTFSLSTSLAAAFAASTLSDLLSTRTSSTFFPSTSG